MRCTPNVSGMLSFLNYPLRHFHKLPISTLTSIKKQLIYDAWAALVNTLWFQAPPLASFEDNQRTSSRPFPPTNRTFRSLLKWLGDPKSRIQDGSYEENPTNRRALALYVYLLTK